MLLVYPTGCRADFLSSSHLYVARSIVFVVEDPFLFLSNVTRYLLGVVCDEYEKKT